MHLRLAISRIKATTKKAHAHAQIEPIARKISQNCNNWIVREFFFSLFAHIPQKRKNFPWLYNVDANNDCRSKAKMHPNWDIWWEYLYGCWKEYKSVQFARTDIRERHSILVEWVYVLSVCKPIPTMMCSMAKNFFATSFIKLLQIEQCFVWNFIYLMPISGKSNNTDTLSESVRETEPKHTQSNEIEIQNINETPKNHWMLVCALSFCQVHSMQSQNKYF